MRLKSNQRMLCIAEPNPQVLTLVSYRYLKTISHQHVSDLLPHLCFNWIKNISAFSISQNSSFETI